MADKTNAVRLVEKAGIPCRESFYEYDENDLNGMHAASAIGMPPEQVFKTLVARGPKNGIHVFCIPVCCELDLKKAAKAAGAKKAEMIPMKELLPLTGYIRGGCSPIGMKKPFPTFFHQTALDFDIIFVSAGVRGLQLKINPQDLISYVKAEVVDLVQSKEKEEDNEYNW
jgi:Cys-tRNA(Pro)/Cys-tRNA(Cys) deacylase